MVYNIGIDPGITGAVAIIATSPDGLSRIEFADTPAELEKHGRKEKLSYRPIEMANILRRYSSSVMTVHAWIEQVGAMPGQGVTSMFGFGKGFGIWIGILSAFKIPHTFVTPQKWKKEMMSGMADKDAARARLQQLYPSAAEELKLKKHIGRADAGLIAEYGRRSMYRANTF